MVTEGIPPRCISHLAQPLVTLHDAQVLSVQILAHSLALFCTLQNLNSFLFNRFRTLRQKTPGGGGQIVKKKSGENFCPYIIFPYFLSPAGTASARRADCRQWLPVPGSAGAAAPAPSLSIPSKC